MLAFSFSSFFILIYFVFFFWRLLLTCTAFFITKFSVPRQFRWGTFPSTWDEADFDLWYTLPFLVMEKISIVKMDIFSAWDTILHIAIPFLYKKPLQSCFNFYKQRKGWGTLLQFSLGTVRHYFKTSHLHNHTKLLATYMLCCEMWHKREHYILIVLKMIKCHNICGAFETVSGI